MFHKYMYCSELFCIPNSQTLNIWLLGMSELYSTNYPAFNFCNSKFIHHFNPHWLRKKIPTNQQTTTEPEHCFHHGTPPNVYIITPLFSFHIN